MIRKKSSKKQVGGIIRKTCREGRLLLPFPHEVTRHRHLLVITSFHSVDLGDLFFWRKLVFFGVQPKVGSKERYHT